MKKLGYLAAGVAVVAVSATALADTVAVSGYGFIPAYSSDVSYIGHNSGRVYNHDSAATHYVAAALPISIFHNVPVAKFYVSSNGQTLRCWLETRNLDTNSIVSVNSATTSSVYTTISLSHTLAHGPRYAHSGFCALPAFNGSYGQVYGATLTAQ